MNAVILDAEDRINNRPDEFVGVIPDANGAVETGRCKQLQSAAASQSSDWLGVVT